MSFLAHIGSYVNILDDLSQEENYMKRKLVAFFEDLGFVDNVSPSREAPRKQNKHFIETRLLGETTIKKGRKVIFYA